MAEYQPTSPNEEPTAVAMELLPLNGPEEVPAPELIPPERYRRFASTPEPHQELKLPPFFRTKVSIYLDRIPPGASRFSPEPARLVQEAQVRFIPARDHRWKQVIRITDEDTAVLPAQELRAHLMTILNDIQEGLTMSTLWAQTQHRDPAPWVPLYILDPTDPFQGHGKIMIDEGCLSYHYHGYPVKMAQQDEVLQLPAPSSPQPGDSPPAVGTHRRVPAPSPEEGTRDATAVDFSRRNEDDPRQCWTIFKPTPEEILIMIIFVVIGILLGMLFIIILVAHCPYWEDCHPILFQFTKCPPNVTNLKCSCPS